MGANGKPGGSEPINGSETSRRSSEERGLRWDAVGGTPAYQELARSKKAFMVPTVVAFTVFFLGWPTLGGFTTILDGQAIGGMTWAYVYGFSQLATTLILLHLYLGRAAKWDTLAKKAREEAVEGRSVV